MLDDDDETTSVAAITVDSITSSGPPSSSNSQIASLSMMAPNVDNDIEFEQQHHLEHHHDDHCQSESSLFISNQSNSSASSWPSPSFLWTTSTPLSSTAKSHLGRRSSPLLWNSRFIFLFVITIQLSLNVSLAAYPFSSAIFEPRVAAKCDRNLMHVSVNFDGPFNGVIHVRNYRRGPCLVTGHGSPNVSLTIDMLSQPGRPGYCGVHKVRGTEERSVSLVVRLHRALELSDDKHFLITCGNTDINAKNRQEKLVFKFVDRSGHKLTKLAAGESYKLRAEVAPRNNTSGLSTSSHSEKLLLNAYRLYVRSCFIFNTNDSDIEFIDSRGCATVPSAIGEFKQVGPNVAEADVKAMFKLPGSNQIHIQCLVELRPGCEPDEPCPESACVLFNSGASNRLRKGKYIEREDDNKKEEEEIQLLASTSTLVHEPHSGRSADGDDERCSEWRFPWLIALCIMLAILLIVMMVVNVFLCSSISCTTNNTGCCGKSEVDDPTLVEEYDPYKYDISAFSYSNTNTPPTYRNMSRLSMGRPFGSHLDLNQHEPTNHNHFISGMQNLALSNSQQPVRSQNHRLSPNSGTGSVQTSSTGASQRRILGNSSHIDSSRPTLSAVRVSNTARNGQNIPSAARTNQPHRFAASHHPNHHRSSPAQSSTRESGEFY